MYLDPQVVVHSFEPFPKFMGVRYHYGDVLVSVVVCYTVVVRLVVSGSLSIVDVVFLVKFVLWSLQSLWWEIGGL